MIRSSVVDHRIVERTRVHLTRIGARLPTFDELAEPDGAEPGLVPDLGEVDPDELDPRNLFRVHWYNDGRGGRVDVPAHLELPPELTGVSARIVMLLGNRFPLIGAHKVLAAYGCLAPRLVTGTFDPTRDRAIWPSTGNYCRGGIAISRMLGCHGVAVLPEGMSRERFEWLEARVLAPEDIVRTPGTESNVKEIYDRCAELARDPENRIINQFAEVGNYLAHWRCTGPAVARVVDQLPGRPRLAAFVSATGSAGTLAAGDYLKATAGARIVAVEALECPTLLANGFGEHNIQGIGDKHVPFIHNVMNTDVVVGVSDRATDQLACLFAQPEGRDYLATRHAVPEAVIEGFPDLGLSSICNLLAAIKIARYFDLGPEDVIATVATDGAALYASEVEKVLARDFRGRFDELTAAETWGRHLAGATIDHVAELGHRERERIFNLGYFTWVEQQGVSIEAFQARRHPAYWQELQQLPAQWDERIREMNAATGQ